MTRIRIPCSELWSEFDAITQDSFYFALMVSWQVIDLEKYSWHDGVIIRKHFPRTWPFVRGIHRSPVNSPHKGQWRGALMFPLSCTWINGWVNDREAGDLRHQINGKRCNTIWTSWRLTSPAIWLFVPQFVQANTENTKAPHYWPFVSESTSDRSIPFSKGQ